MTSDRIAPLRALLSVSDKTGIVELGRFLHHKEVELLSTGGTAQALREAGLPVKDVADYTGQPEIMGGRVKTLHPIIHGGILAKRDAPDHMQALFDLGAGPIDLVVVNLYPFEATVKSGADDASTIEQIDIGGPAMIRSSAKNHASVAVATSPDDYAELRAMIEATGGTDLAFRRKLALRAFRHTAAYDSAIANWFQKDQENRTPPQFTLTGRLQEKLRYGENPQQSAGFYVTSTERPGVATSRQIQGKQLSYNNINDTDAAFELAGEFDTPAIAIIKHANPCGAATGETLSEAYDSALASDPVSAFGGIVACNRPLDAATAQKLVEIFLEVVIAPAVADDAKTLLAAKPNLRVLEAGSMPSAQDPVMLVKSVAGGFLVQERDLAAIDATKARIVSARQPSSEELYDLSFAMRVCRHVKSNAIVLVRNNATIGIGAGQMSRVDAVEAAIKKADAQTSANPCVLASDAFFPFPDGLESAAKAGVTAVIQPGGSIRDDEVIATADKAGMAMVFTGTRHFRH